ncbi:D-tyrosyl-tRNA(Tyr) deacylase [Borealophlyctis nickersoniae]|nr:D-tyrosyl-tRNA(Tyr) deacylase [Borealophlyctis nickersoniae]
MRAVLQRVSSACVTGNWGGVFGAVSSGQIFGPGVFESVDMSLPVNGDVVGRINKGICVLVGIAVDDQEKDMDYMVRKLLGIRVFEDASNKMWAKSVKDLSLEILCVSQFTLYANSYKGNKPDFHLAMKTEQSKEFYERFLGKLRAAYDPSKIQDGVFGAMMKVDIVNEGPITLILDSRKPVTDSENGKSSPAPATPDPTS